MASGETLLERLRASQAGHSQRDICSVLEYYGFEFQRPAKHGALYRHPELAEHPDIEVRKKYSHVIVPKGDDLLPYVARKVLGSLDALFSMREEKADAES